MVEKYAIENGNLKSANDGKVLAYYNITDEEKNELLTRYEVDQHTLQSALDAEEISRLEYQGHNLSIIWKYPTSLALDKDYIFDVLSIGIFLKDDTVLIVSQERIHYLDELQRIKLDGSLDVILNILNITVKHFLEHLKTIRYISREIQQKINQAMGNDYLLKMFDLSEILVQYNYSIDSNKIVLKKFRTWTADKESEKFGSMVEDLLIENEQANRQAEIYSQIFTGLMDARGTIVNNNMNMLIKNLTIINIIFLPLTLIASIGGMSEYSMMTHGIKWEISYFLFSVGMVIIGYITFRLLNKIDKKPFTKKKFKKWGKK